MDMERIALELSHGALPKAAMAGRKGGHPGREKSHCSVRQSGRGDGYELLQSLQARGMAPLPGVKRLPSLPFSQNPLA